MAAQVYLITGDDEPGIDLEARRVFRELTGDNPDPAAVETYREREDFKGAELLHQAIAAVLSPPFLGNTKTVWLHCSSGLVPAGGARAAKSGEGLAFKRLSEAIAAGLAPGIAFVVSGPGADENKPLSAACGEQGQVVHCRRPDPKNRGWQSDMALLIQRRARAKGIELAAEAVTYLVGMLGANTAPLDGELEKLFCYAGGPGNVVTAAMVEEMCQGEGEATSWSFLDAVGERRLDNALELAGVVLAREKEAEREKTIRGLLLALAGQFRAMLQIRVFMQEQSGLRGGEQLKAAVQRMSGEQKAVALRQGFEFVEMHPFRLAKLAGQAANFRGNELVGSLPKIRDAYWKCVGGGATVPHAVLDDLLVQLVKG